MSQKDEPFHASQKRRTISVVKMAYKAQLRVNKQEIHMDFSNFL